MHKRIGYRFLFGLFHLIRHFETFKSTDLQYVTDPNYSLPTKVLFTAAMLFSFLVSITGNFLVIYVIMTNRVMRTSTNCLIMNLAFCDFLISLLQTPHLIKQLYIGKIWFGGAAGKVLCKSYTFGGSVLLNSSVYSLVAIAIDRFLAVTRPLTHKTTSKLVLKIGILLIWIVSTLLSLRLVISSRIHYGEDGTPNCMYFAQSTKELFTSASCFIGSFVLIAVLYSIIAYRLWMRKLPGECSNTQQDLARRTARRVTLLMISVVLLFAASWTPAFVTLSLAMFHPSSAEIFMQYPFLIAFTYWLMLTSSACNPCLYFVFIESFRSNLKAVFYKCCSTLLRICRVGAAKRQSLALETREQMRRQPIIELTAYSTASNTNTELLEK